MASGPRLKPLNTGGMAAMYANIAQAILGTGEAQGAMYANLGRSIGGGIAAMGANRREDRRARDDAAERADARAERRAEREADRAESRARWDAEFQAEQAYKQQALDLRRAEGAAAVKKEEMEQAQAKAAFAAKVADLTGQEPDQDAQAEAETKGGVLQTLLRKIRGVVVPTVLREDGQGGYVDETAPEVLMQEEVRKLQRTTATMAAAKDPADIYALRAVRTATERNIRGIAASIAARKQQAERAATLREKITATKKATEARRISLRAVQDWARAHGVPVNEAARVVMADLQHGSSPETIRAALNARFKAEPTEPTPTEKGVAQGTQRFAADEQERKMRMELPADERDRRADAEYAEWLRRHPDSDESTRDEVLWSILGSWGLR